MDKTMVVQICLSLVVLYGFVNVIHTELSGNGLCSLIKPIKYHGDNDKVLNPAAGSNAPKVIYLNAKKVPHSRRGCFKYFTAHDGTWVETCILSDDIPKNYSEK